LREEKEENSKGIAEKSQQIDALHIQLNEMRFGEKMDQRINLV
jgi:hypothetical protein